MSSFEDWRSSLGFSERFSSIVKITTAITAANPSLDQAAARLTAKFAEEDAFKSAKSRDEYEEHCNAVVVEYESTTPLAVAEAEGAADGDGDVVATESITIGPYVNATYHKNGITSTVYRARIHAEVHQRIKQSHPHSGLVALKVTELAAMEPPHDCRREVRILRRATAPHIIPLLEDFPLAGSRLVLVFPFMHYDLPLLLSKGTSFTAEQRKSCLHNLFSALAHLHSLGIIHRDVKPSNILLKSPNGPAFLADFGIAWDPQDTASEPADKKITDVGTTCYRPPELLFGNTSYSYALDMWAAGCVVAEVIDDSIESLFEAGDLGSELALIRSTFKKLGTPNANTWPEAATFRDWGKMEFFEYPAQPWEELLPRASPAGRALVSSLLRYESGQRLSATEALTHGFLEAT